MTGGLDAPIVKVNDPNTKDLFCGPLAENTITSGQGSGPNTFELRPATSVRTGALSSARFGGWVSSDRPALGTYVCVWLLQGAPMGGFESQVRPGEAGASVPRASRLAAAPQSTFQMTDSPAAPVVEVGVPTYAHPCGGTKPIGVIEAM